jgi:hypothetical protein
VLTERERREFDESVCQSIQEGEEGFKYQPRQKWRVSLAWQLEETKRDGDTHLFHPVTGIVLTVATTVAAASVSRSIAALREELAIVLRLRTRLAVSRRMDL